MRNIVLTSMLLVFLPLLAVAQSNDDLYFIPKKNKETKKVEAVSKEVSARTVDASMSSSAPSVVVRDTKGNIRDVDEYNRRYTSRDNKFSSDGETLYVDEKPYDERGEWVNGFQGSDMDYEYAMRIVRFRSPRYAIPVSSPLYWDVVYGALPSWDWNVYDDGMYAYVFPTYTNRLWWDWRWSSSFYGPSFGFSMSWGYPWYYNNWHSPYWYDRWYGGWYGGYWGHHHHCHYYDYPYYGSSSRWYRSGHTDYRPGRYQSYTRGSNISSGNSGSSFTRRPQNSSSEIRYNRANTASRRSSIGRVVSGSSSSRGESVNSVRPGRTAIRNNNGISTGTGSRVNSGAYTRPSSRPYSRQNSGTYIRRSSTNVDRSGSNYSRPSSTRRSSSYNSRSSQSTYQRSSESSFRRSSNSGYSRSSGGSVTRSGGGSSRRR